MKHAKMKLLTALTEQSQHYKLYKSGRHWLLMGLTTATLGLAGGVTGANATTTTATATTPQTTQTTTSAAPVTTTTTSNAASSAAPATSATATPAPTTTNLGDATASDVAAAKSAAANTAATTGQAQQVTAVSATPASTANDTEAAAPADTTGAASTTPATTSAAATTPTTTDAADTTAELAALSDDVKQAMALSGVTYDKENLSADGSNYYFWGTYDYTGSHLFTADVFKSHITSATDEHVQEVITATQVLSNNDQLLQKLAAQGITANVLLQPNFPDMDTNDWVLFAGQSEDLKSPGYSGTVLNADYQVTDPSTQTIQYIDDSNQTTLATDVENSTIDATSSVQTEIDQLRNNDLVVVSNNYQAPTNVMTVDAAVTAVQAGLEQTLTAYNTANGTDYQLHLTETVPVAGQNQIEYRFLLTSEKLGHEAWDTLIQNWITDHSTPYSDENGNQEYGVDPFYNPFDLNTAIQESGNDYSNSDFKNATVAADQQIQTDMPAILSQLSQDSSLITAFETLRANNRNISLVGAPTYNDATLTYESKEPIIDSTTGDITGYKDPVEHTLDVTGLSDDMLNETFVGVTGQLNQTGTNTTYQVHLREVKIDNGVQVRSQIPDGASVSPDDYYDFTQPGQVADGIQVKTQVQVPDAVSVTPADYYNNLTPGQVDDGIQVKTQVQVPDAVSVTPADYYDNTTPGQVDDGVLVKTKVQVPAAVSVTPADYYDNTTPGQVDDGILVKTKVQVPAAVSVTPTDYYDNTTPGQVDDGVLVKTKVQVPAAVSVTPTDYYDNTTPGQVDDGVLVKTKVQVPAAVSVTPADYYDHTAKTQVPDTDANGNDTPSTTPTTGQRDNTPVPATVPSTSQPATAVTATTTPTATVTPAHTAAQTTATPAAAQATTLPQTGAADETALLVLGGLTILGSIGLLGATKMRKRHDGSYDL